MTSTRAGHAVWIGSTLLAVGALFHLTGYVSIPSAPPVGGPEKFFGAALRALWLFAGLHWLLIATICVIAAKSRAGFTRLILLCCAVIILTDAALLFWFLGPFIGAAILVAAGIAFLIGFFRLPSETKEAV